MAAGEIEVLVLGTAVNPAFTLPGGLKVAEAIRKVPFVVSFANLPDETTALAHLVLPDTHWLESWGDYAPREGVLGLMQPTMKPIRDARPMGDVLLAVGRAALGTEEGKGPLPWTTFEQFLKATWEPVVKGQWEAALQQGGVWRDTPAAAVAVTPKLERVEAATAKLEGHADGLALLRLSLAALLRRPRRHPGLAAGSARPDHAGGVGRLGGDQHRRPRRGWASARVTS